MERFTDVERLLLVTLRDEMSAGRVRFTLNEKKLIIVGPNFADNVEGSQEFFDELARIREEIEKSRESE